MTTIISDAGVQFAGGNIVDVRSTVPTSGTYTAGDFILESTTAVKVTGWKRLTTGSGHVLNTDWAYVGGLTLGTAVATTSGTSIDFTGIPSWAKRITVMFNGVSTNGTSNWQVQIGAGSIQTTGYSSSNSSGSGGVTSNSITSGHFLAGNITAAAVFSGQLVLTSMGSNLWVVTSMLASVGSAGFYIGGSSVALSGTLDRIRLTTVSGTDTFDVGSVNILYE